MAVKLAPKPSSSVDFTLISEVSNLLSGGFSYNKQPVSAAAAILSESNDSPSKKMQVRARLSSAGQLDLAALGVVEDSALALLGAQLGTENAVEVVGVWMLGAATAKKKSSSHGVDSAASSVGPINIAVPPQERAVECFPVELSDKFIHSHPSPDMSNNIPCGTSWLLPLPENARCRRESFSAVSSGGGNGFTSSQQADLLPVLVEQFLCVVASNEQFLSEISASWASYNQRLAEQEATGPRTISQVRRDNNKQDEAAAAVAAQESADSMADLDESMERPSLFDDALTHSLSRLGIEHTTTGLRVHHSSSFSSSFPLSRSRTTSADLSYTLANQTSPPKALLPGGDGETTSVDAVTSVAIPPTVPSMMQPRSKDIQMPRSAQELAWQEIPAQRVTIAFVWMCNWQDRVRWGVHSVSGVSFVAPSALPVASRRSSQAAVVAGVPSSVPPTLAASLTSTPILGAAQASPLPGSAHTSSPLPPITAAVSPLLERGASPLPVPQIPVSTHNPSESAYEGRCAVDFLLVSLTHTARATLNSQSADSSCLLGCMVPVTMVCKNIGDQAILLIVEGLDSQSHFANEHLASSSNPTATSKGLIPQVACSGFRWQGKTKYSDVILQPHSEVTLTFLAFLTHPGVYDLKKYELISYCLLFYIVNCL